MVRVIPTARAARLTMDREGIRRLAAETLGLPTSPYKFATRSTSCRRRSTREASAIPCVVKPVMSISGKGQSKIDGPADVAAGLGLRAWPAAASSHGRVIVEGFIDFDYEITLLTVRALDAPARCRRSFCEPIGHRAGERRLRRELAAAPDDAARALSARSEIAQAVTADLGGHGLFGVELFVQGRPGLVQRGQPAAARHRHGHDGHAVAERVRAACARDPRPAGRHHAARARAPAP